MKKYINPKMEIKSFCSEAVLTSSALETQMNGWGTENSNHTLLTIDMTTAQKIDWIF